MTLMLRMSRVAKISLVFALIFSILAYISRDNSQEQLNTILKGLLRIEESVTINNNLRIAVGFGSCEDVIVSGTKLLSSLRVEFPEHVTHHHSIHNMTELLQMFAYFFGHGAAAERYISNETLFKYIVNIAKNDKNARSIMGGNAPVMVKNFQKKGFEVVLGAQMSYKLKKSLGDNINVVGNTVSEDDIHLILEYEKDAQWGSLTSPRANRFIIHNDQNNPKLSSLEKFAEEVSSFKPHLVIIGGLQMMDNFPFLLGERLDRLNKLAVVLGSLDNNTHIHFEMAHFTEQNCLEDILDTVAYHADSLGMNEQELPNLLGLLSNGSVTLVSDITPRTATTLDQMRLLFHLLNNRSIAIDNKLEASFGNLSEIPFRQRHLTRIHVHTLAFQAIMTKSGSAWKNSKQAVAMAALTANRHTCGSQDVNVDTSRLIMDGSFSTAQKKGSKRITIHPEEPVTCWKEGDIDICLAPVIVCTKVIQTVGGGDNISSSGLMVQI